MRFLKPIAVLSFVAFSCLMANGQEHILDKNVQDQIDKPLEGPNSAYYNYNSINMGVFLPIEEGDTLTNGVGLVIRSVNHYKFKLTSWDSFILDFAYEFNTIKLKEDSVSNPFYRFGGFEKQRFTNHKLELGAFNRINFDKRGNYIGKYLDFGAWAGYNISQRIKTKYELDPALNGGVESGKTVLGKLQFTEKVSYGLGARIGLNKVELSANYRLSNFFKATDGRFQDSGIVASFIPDMPRLTFTVGIAIDDQD